MLVRSACAADAPGFDSRLSDWLPVAEMTLVVPDPLPGAPPAPPSAQRAGAALRGLCLEAHAALDYIIGRKGFAFGAKKGGAAAPPPLAWAVEETQSYYQAEDALKSGAAGAAAQGSTGTGGGTVQSVADAFRALELDASASQDEIRKSYRRLSAKFHPDVAPRDDDDAAAAAAKRYNEVRMANEVLKRRASNQLGSYEELAPGGNRTPLEKLDTPPMASPVDFDAAAADRAAAIVLQGVDYALAPLDRSSSEPFLLRNASRTAR